MVGRFWKSITGAYEVCLCDGLEPTDKIYPLHPDHDLSDARFNNIRHGMITGFEIVEEIVDCGFHGSSMQEYAKLKPL